MLCVHGSPLYQWDINRQLLIDSADLGSDFVIHCCYTEDSNAPVVEPIIDGDKVLVNIPNILLQRYGHLRVYVVVEGDTVYDATFYVMARPKPEDYIYTETEVLSYVSLSKRMDDFEKNGIGEEKIAKAIGDYVEKHSISETINYPGVKNKPKINGVELKGDLTPEDLGIESIDHRIMKITVEYDAEEDRYKSSHTCEEIWTHINDPFTNGMCFLEYYDESTEVRIIARDNFFERDRIVFSYHWFNPEHESEYQGEGLYYHIAIWDDGTVDVYSEEFKIADRVSQLYNDLGFVRGSEIKSTIENALTTAKESGEFKGDAFTYEDFTEEQLESLKGKDGNDYVLTKSDKQEIANMTIQLIPVYQGEVESI